MRIFILTALILFLASPVHAAAADQAAIVARALTAAQSLGRPYGVTIVTNGTPVAAHDGVQIPGLSITGMDGSTYNCGRVIVHLTPQGLNHYRLDLLLPSSVTGTTAAGKPLSAGFAHESIGATWDDGAAQMSDLAAQFSGLIVTADKTRTSVQSLTAFYHPDGAFAVNMRDVAMRDKEIENRIAALSLTGRIGAGAPGSVSFTARGTGMVQSPPAPALPDHFDADINIAPMPWAKLADLSKLLFVAGIPQSMTMLRIELMLGLPRVLGEAHSIVAIHALSFGNTLYHAEASGQLTMDAKAPDGALGHIHARIVGLNAVTSALNGEPPAGVLTAINLAGQQGPGSDERLYNIDFHRDGPATLNGVDVSSFIFAPLDKKSVPVTTP